MDQAFGSLCAASGGDKPTFPVSRSVPGAATDFSDIPSMGVLGQGNRLQGRTPIRFRERLINMFRSPENVRYLRHLFEERVMEGPMRDYAINTLMDAVYSFEEIEPLIVSDTLARRGQASRSKDLWSELRRLNLVFFERRMETIRENAALITGTHEELEDNEPFLMRAFIAESLRPPGRESLNGYGPLYGTLQDQTFVSNQVYPETTNVVWKDEIPGAAKDRNTTFSGETATKKEKFTTCPPPQTQSGTMKQARVSTAAPEPVYGYFDPADPTNTTPPDPTRTPDQAIADYWGEGNVESESTLRLYEFGPPHNKAITNQQRFAEGPLWREAGGTRYQRYEHPPRWQNAKRGKPDYNIDGTLGMGMKDTGNHVRKWDMDRIRNFRGEEYRRYGPRNTSTL